ncbi:MAG: sugar ABC transporter permease [Chloroflexota bacterium]|nr:sugar ABC transporter permease [Chloroflexota bacterium]|tara:strand:- start:185 stop:1135 length:951 start_codon:yes stop_codon:yes gene_type:complete
MATTASSQPARRRGFRFGRRGGLAGYFFVTPSLLFLIVFVIIPIIAAFYYSLTDYDLMRAPRFAGMKNYSNLFDDDRFRHSIMNTLYFAAGTVPSGVITSLLLAALINRSIRGIYTFRALFYMPVVSSFVSVSLIWLWLYEPQFGLFNDALESLGIARSKWLRDDNTSMPSIILMSVWKNMGLNMVIYLAGLQGIPPHLYEASEIDGAGRASQFFRITLPLLAPTTFFVVIVYFIGALQMFVQVWIMTGNTGIAGEPAGSAGGPLDSTLTVVVLLYANAFEFMKMGYAASMSVILFLMISVVTIFNARMLRYDISF